MNTTTSSTHRYQLVQKIGSGDYAVTFSGYDQKLDRDVAIKQLHHQFLIDDTTLANYWKEAQLLASLEHPNNMTIYDVDREQGQLVLELMQGSLSHIYGNKPMPINDVRQTLVQALHGLECLHENGIIHGDVKPSNLFLSRQEVVKLGDFGLARRVEDEEGSLFKGSARYIAPELVSDEFGKVGPASDLYSLGFSALELLVGPEFESLFPDLIAFGRDRKMAWMMWHCAADRKIPPIQKILDGVPDDLAHVITKLTTKSQSERYTTAGEALTELSAYPVPVGRTLKEEAAARAALARKKLAKKRKWIAASWVASIALSCMIFYLSMDPPPAVERIVPPAIHGVVKNVLPLDRKLVLDLGTDWKEVNLTDNDNVTLNRKGRQLRDLELGDRVALHTRLDPENASHLDVIAFRPETHSGVIESLDSDGRKFVLTVAEGEDASQQFELAVPAETPIVINTLSTEEDASLSFASLASGDRVVVEHSDDESGMLALSVNALRDVKMTGFVRSIEPRSRLLTVAIDEQEKDAAKFARIPLYPDCVFTLNGLLELNEQLVRLNDILPGDKIAVKHDAKAKTIDAYRVFHASGKLASIEFDKRSFSVTSTAKKGAGGEVRFNVDHDCKVWLGGSPIRFEDLRAGDELKISHDSPGAAEPKVDRITAMRPPSPNKWAILIANQNFDDRTIQPRPNSILSAQELRNSLTHRYAVPEEQALICQDFDRVRLEHEIPNWLRGIPKGAELYVYVSTSVHNDKQVVLSTKDSKSSDIEQTGLQLDWLIDQLENCPTETKVLLLDCDSVDPKSDPMDACPEQMIAKLRSVRRGGYPRSLYVMGCASNSVSFDKGSSPRSSFFATTLADGFSGAADQSRDNRIEITELAEFAVMKMGSSTDSNTIANAKRSAPVLILPDPSPARISAEAKHAVLGILSHYEDRKLDVKQIYAEAESADALGDHQPDANLALGLVLLKHSKMPQALEVLDGVRLSHADQLLAHRAVIWLHFYKNKYDIGFAKLNQLLERIPSADEMKSGYDEETLALFEWAGRLRQLAQSADWTTRLPAEIDLQKYNSSFQRFGVEAIRREKLGRDFVVNAISEFERNAAEGKPGYEFFRKDNVDQYVGKIANLDSLRQIKSGLDK